MSVAPEPTRTVPDGWIELTAHFIEEVKLGIHAGWTHLPDLSSEPGGVVVYTPEDGSTPRAWAVRLDRILGSPVPVTSGEAKCSECNVAVSYETGFSMTGGLGDNSEDRIYCPKHAPNPGKSYSLSDLEKTCPKRF